MFTVRWFSYLQIAAFLFVASTRGAVHTPAPGSGPFFNVMDYGAHNDGAGASTEAFRAAIEAARKAGGGTVYVPAGKYLSGPIELISNLTLYIDAGATINFPAAMLPFTPGRQQGVNRASTGRGDAHSGSIDWRPRSGKCGR